MSSDREIVCSRVVIDDSEFNAKKGQGERPGPPVCFCAIEIRSERPRDRAPAGGSVSGKTAVGAR